MFLLVSVWSIEPEAKENEGFCQRELYVGTCIKCSGQKGKHYRNLKNLCELPLIYQGGSGAKYEEFHSKMKEPPFETMYADG